MAEAQSDDQAKDSQAKDRSEDPAKDKPKVNPALKVGLLIILMGACILLWNSLSDRFSPTTTRGLVGANIAQIAPRVSGRLVKVEVVSNTKVKAGDLLFKIDPRSYQITADSARVDLQSATQNVEASTAQLAAAQADVANARATLENAEIAWTRSARLRKDGYVSQARLDQDVANRDSAHAALNAAEAKAESARQELGELGVDNVRIRAAALKLEQAEYDLLSTSVQAPENGVITNSHLAPGQYIAAGDAAMTFIETDIRWVSANFRENQLGNVDPGDEAAVLFDAMPGKIFPARVESIAWGINPGFQESNGLPVSQPPNQWFEPARRIPVRVVLDGGMENWPETARVGGKVYVVVYAEGRAHPVALISRVLQRLMSFVTFVY